MTKPGALAETATDLSSLSSKIELLLQNINAVLVGQSQAAKLSVITLLAGGHLIIEDVPGVGKTLLAKSLAHSITASFRRVQCTPDLLPSDISGISIFDQRESNFRFVPGPVFTNILLMDEINRATPRTQSSLLEAMEEHQVTTDGVARPLPELFVVIATENPIEQHGTFPLPEAQLDRFMIALSLGYPTAADEAKILFKTLADDDFSADAVLTVEEVLQARQAVKTVTVHDTLVNYIVSIVNATRHHPSIALGVSPRGSQLLLRASQAAAFSEGRRYVTPDDIKLMAPAVLGHRIVPKAKGKKISYAEIIHKLLESVAVPG